MKELSLRVRGQKEVEKLMKTKRAKKTNLVSSCSAEQNPLQHSLSEAVESYWNSLYHFWGYACENKPPRYFPRP